MARKPTFEGKELILGNIYVSKAIMDSMVDNLDVSFFINKCIERHRKMDWGDLRDIDWEANDEAIRNGKIVRKKYVRLGDDNIISSYNIPDELFPQFKSSFYGKDKNIWIITETQSVYTTILYPCEY